MAKKHTLIDIKSGKTDPAVEIAARYGNKPDALLEILHDVQQELGFVPEASLPVGHYGIDVETFSFGTRRWFLAKQFSLAPDSRNRLTLPF